MFESIRVTGAFSAAGIIQDRRLWRVVVAGVVVALILTVCAGSSGDDLNPAIAVGQPCKSSARLAACRGLHQCENIASAAAGVAVPALSAISPAECRGRGGAVSVIQARIPEKPQPSLDQTGASPLGVGTRLVSALLDRTIKPRKFVSHGSRVVLRHVKVRE